MTITPGQLLCSSSANYIAGEGTYIRDGNIHATLLGEKQETTREDGKVEVSVKRPGAVPSIVPTVGTIVTCRIISINPNRAKAQILCVGAVPLQSAFSGLIRVQDIRLEERSKVTVYTSFRPGDIVLAKVISLGDARSYFLSTAEKELGVVSARDGDGQPMKPISKTEMASKAVREKRKVAQVSFSSNEDSADANDKDQTNKGSMDAAEDE